MGQRLNGLALVTSGRRTPNTDVVQGVSIEDSPLIDVQKRVRFGESSPNQPWTGILAAARHAVFPSLDVHSIHG